MNRFIDKLKSFFLKEKLNESVVDLEKEDGILLNGMYYDARTLFYHDISIETRIRNIIYNYCVNQGWNYYRNFSTINSRDWPYVRDFLRGKCEKIRVGFFLVVPEEDFDETRLKTNISEMGFAFYKDLPIVSVNNKKYIFFG